MRLRVEQRLRRRTGFALDVAFESNADAIGIVGPSGSGKSTLLEGIAGLEPGAHVVLDGADLSHVEVDERAFGYVSQDALLFPHQTIEQNLLYSPRARAAEVGRVAAALGIDALLGRMPRHLSGGERRRAALARAILSTPRLLLLDEPFAGLDEQRRREAMALLFEVRRRFSIPMILVSHAADEILGLTDWSVRLEAGRVTAAGPTPTLLRAGELHVDNYFTGEVCGHDRVRVGERELFVLLPKGAPARVRLACYAHDIFLAAEGTVRTSARNALAVTVTELLEAGDAVLVGLEPDGWRAFVTREACEALDLRPGARAWALIKATSITYLGPAA